MGMGGGDGNGNGKGGWEEGDGILTVLLRPMFALIWTCLWGYMDACDFLFPFSRMSLFFCQSNINDMKTIFDDLAAMVAEQGEVVGM